MSYITIKDVHTFLKEGKVVRSAIAGCVGRLSEVYNGFIYLQKDRGRYRSRADAKASFTIHITDKIVAVNNADGSITLWNESLAPKPQPKRYMFVVKETLTRHRHYYVEAETADEADKKIEDFSNVVHQAAPSNEHVDVLDFDVLELIVDENGE